MSYFIVIVLSLLVGVYVGYKHGQRIQGWFD